MPEDREEAVERMRRDHEHMLGLIERIVSYCDQRDRLASCNDCQSTQHTVCHGNIELLIRAFVEMTLKHNLIESMYMDEIVPSEHRTAHNQAHMDIAQQLKEIRLVFTADGNGIQAIEGIDRVRQTLIGHFRDHDQQLEAYLSATAASG
jgi:hemerythrin